jgi:hypothetical protein
VIGFVPHASHIYSSFGSFWNASYTIIRLLTCYLYSKKKRFTLALLLSISIPYTYPTPLHSTSIYSPVVLSLDLLLKKGLDDHIISITSSSSFKVLRTQRYRNTQNFIEYVYHGVNEWVRVYVLAILVVSCKCRYDAIRMSYDAVVHETENISDYWCIMHQVFSTAATVRNGKVVKGLQSTKIEHV